MISNPASREFAIGGRLGLRNAAREILLAVWQLSTDDVEGCGWTPTEIAALEMIAEMPIDGMSFGDWPP